MVDNVIVDEVADEEKTETKAQENSNTKKQIENKRSGNLTNNQKLESDRVLGDSTNISRGSTAGGEDILLTIGCKFPNGVVIHINGRPILLKGIQNMPNRSNLRNYGGIGFTQIQQSLWNVFLKSHPKWPPLENGSVFVVGENNGG